MGRWKKEKGFDSITEDMLLEYLAELSQMYAPTLLQTEEVPAEVRQRVHQTVWLPATVGQRGQFRVNSQFAILQRRIVPGQGHAHPCGGEVGAGHN